MSFSTVLSAVLQGLSVELIHVEADVSNGLPAFHMVGYLSSEVKEASERVRTAIHNSEIRLPAKKVVINLSPATVKKKGPAFDLPIAVAILASLGMIPGEEVKDTLIIGELSLDGEIRKVAGILPMVQEAKRAGCKTCILPKANAAEGALVDGICIIGAARLQEVCLHLTKKSIISREPHIISKEQCDELDSDGLDYSEIQGQQGVKRAVEVAVAGGHNLLFVGPPGSGKSMIARRVPTILPPVTKQESMEITKIYSILGMVDKNRPLITGRPFRSVHHTVTKSALIGGGQIPVPGEISLAHGGVLFMDELTEFQKPVLEVLREPLEEHQIRIARAGGSYVFPADFMLISAMNPCPCGNYPDMNKCNCTPGQIQHYLSKVSQPFLDRIDICMEAPKVAYEELKRTDGQEGSKEMRERVCKAREIQARRYGEKNGKVNASLELKEMKQFCALGATEEALMKKAYERLGLTARTYHKILRVARTIADIEGTERIEHAHLKEAIGYRILDKKYWGR